MKFQGNGSVELAMGKVHGIEQGKKIRIFQDDFGRLFWCNKYIV